MIRKNTLMSLTLPLMMASPSMVAAKFMPNKQLAGPPSEIEFMQPAAAEKSALSSKTALIPVKLQQTKAGNWFWNASLPVDSIDFNFIVFANGAKNWQIDLVNPVTRQVKSVQDLATDQKSTNYGMENQQYSGEQYSFKNMDTGQWQIRVKTLGEPDQTEGFIMIANSSKYLLSSYQTNADKIVGHRMHFVAQSTSNEETIEVLKDYNPLQSSHMVVSYPNGKQETFNMYDDGLHGDNKANDGLFGGDFIAPKAGNYNVQIHAYGINPDNTPFYRTTEHLMPVIDQTLTMSDKTVQSAVISDNRLNLNMNVQDHAKSANNSYRIIAEVWGESNEKAGVMQPVSWISTITEVQNSQLNIELDARWIAMAKVGHNFELRNLRIEDADHFIPLISEKSLDLNMSELPKAANKAFNGEINEEMMMGVRPAELDADANKAGRRLLLVHGYCSGDVWGPVAGQFSSRSIFRDLNQNRSHNAFAQRIRNFGAQYSSFGIVAHSQGGAASLHLLTYYWSGLDRATGGRVIQSVGTPYQGTPLAGNLAALGSIFGVGCGRNTNLTTSGAASWLSGIPTSSRNKVNYYTTSFTDKWWRPDWCSLATDLFLRDPDDGVIERSRGQLSGGINRGHKTGQCHTSSMRDPAQTRDSGRNSTMNSRAAR